MDKKNLIQRIISALILGPIALYAVYLGSFYFLVFAAIALFFSIKEMSAILNKKTIKVAIVPFMLFSFIALYVSYMQNEVYLLYTFIAFQLVIFAVELFRLEENPLLNNAGSFLSFAYVTLAICSLILVREQYSVMFKVDYTQGAYFVFLFFIGIWSCDTFAYFGGTLLGKHKLYPRISPKKSVEGAVFGLVFALICTYFFAQNFLPELSLNLTLLIGVICGTLGQIGDLIESQFKRNAGVKDSGTAIPGHGGVLDRLDSIIYVSPVLFLVLHFYHSFMNA